MKEGTPIPDTNTEPRHIVRNPGLNNALHHEKERAKIFELALRPNVLDVSRLRLLSVKGIPDQSNLRPLVWRILLNYLPNDRRR